MPEPRTTPKEHDKPGFQPGTPTPEDPRQREPIQDPPVDPEHDDIERVNPVRQAEHEDVERADPAPSVDDDIERGVGASDPSPDRVLFDESHSLG